MKPIWAIGPQPLFGPGDSRFQWRLSVCTTDSCRRTGYVGLTTGACLASLGHHVICADVDEEKIRRLRDGKVDIPRPGLSELVVEGLAAGRLSFIVGAAVALAQHTEGVEVVFFVCQRRWGSAGSLICELWRRFWTKFAIRSRPLCDREQIHRPRRHRHQNCGVVGAIRRRGHQ